MERKITDISELEDVADEVLEKLAERENENSASVLALHGDLGSGKTTFIQVLAKKLGVMDIVTSPTFVVMKSYELENQPFKKLIHIDAYRIEDIDEMRPLGFSELLRKKDTIICIEWAEKIAELLPPYTLHMHMEIEGEAREIIFG